MKWYEVNDSYYDNPTEYEKMGYDIGNVNMLDYDECLCAENCIFDYKGRILKKYNYHIETCGDFTNDPFDNGVAFVVDDPKKEYGERKYALMDFDGNILTDFFDRVDHGWVDDTYIAVKKNGKYGIINKFGNQVTEFRFDWPSTDYEWDHCSSYVKVCNHSEYGNDYKQLGLFAFTGKLILEPIYKELEIVTDYPYFKKKSERISALLTDIIYITDFNNNKFRYTHRLGLERVE